MGENGSNDNWGATSTDSDMNSGFENVRESAKEPTIQSQPYLFVCVAFVECPIFYLFSTTLLFLHYSLAIHS